MAKYTWTPSQADLILEAVQRIEHKLGLMQALTIPQLMRAFDLDEVQVMRGLEELGTLYRVRSD